VKRHRCDQDEEEEHGGLADADVPEYLDRSRERRHVAGRARGEQRGEEQREQDVRDQRDDKEPC